MATANIIKTWQDGINAYLAVQVAESNGNHEYVGSVLLSDLNALPNNAAKKAALVAAVKVVRDAQVAPTLTDLSAIASGSVTI